MVTRYVDAFVRLRVILFWIKIIVAEHSVYIMVKCSSVQENLVTDKIKCVNLEAQYKQWDYILFAVTMKAAK